MRIRETGEVGGWKIQKDERGESGKRRKMNEYQEI